MTQPGLYTPSPTLYSVRYRNYLGQLMYLVFSFRTLIEASLLRNISKLIAFQTYYNQTPHFVLLDLIVTPRIATSLKLFTIYVLRRLS